MPQPPRISRYEIKSPIGGGGMGTLYLARDTNPTTDRLVALKLLKANLDSGDLRARFAREAQSLARLNHSNIVSIYDSGEYRGAPFIVMEYVRGETLAERMKRRAPFSLSHKLTLLAELCAGLAHAHEAGVIHRDIKPANLMVDQKGHLKIVDFGIARDDSQKRLGLHVTQLNMQIGTPGYMSPEQIEGGDVDARSDIFAAGAVAYELLSGQEAFAGANTMQIERKVLQAQPAPLVTLVRGLDPAIADIVSRALEKDPNLRFQDAQSMEDAFLAQRARLGTGDTPLPPRTTPVPGPLRPRGSRADAAYQQAVAMLRDGAPEAARRYLLEAVAESAGHTDAQALLDQIEGGATRHDSTLLAYLPSAGNMRRDPLDEVRGRDAGPDVDDGSLEPTVVIRPRTWTTPGSRGRDSADGVVPAGNALLGDGASDDAGYGSRDFAPETGPQDATIVVRSRTKGATTSHPRSRATSQATGTASTGPADRWTTPVHLAAIGVPLVVAAITVGILAWRPWDAGFRLAVEKPEGGTITARGIECGPARDLCAASFADADVVEFEAHAEDGFTFTGFTGDCAPGGRVMMNGDRQCGATFERSSGSDTAGGTVLLTIAPPTGGTIFGQGVLCGTQGTACSSQLALGFDVQLQGRADPGYVLQGFSGDCSPDGRASMVAPRTCGATFVGSSPGAPGSGREETGVAPLAPGARTVTTGASAGAGVSPSTPRGPAGTMSGGAGVGAPAAGGAAGGPTPQGAGTPPTGGADDPSKPVRPVITREAASRILIGETLDRYLAAYGKLDYEELRTVFPTAPRNIRVQLEQYRSLDYSFGGPPKFLKLDPEGGAALIELDYKQVFKPKVGGEQPPNEGRVTFQLHRLENDDWVIDSALFRPKK